MSVFRLEAMPAREGDALLLSYGGSEHDLRHVVIDAGRSSTGKALAAHLVGQGIARIEALVVTHVDADHIEGTLDFLKAVRAKVEIADVWFNGYRHLSDVEELGAAQGEDLTALIALLSWNRVVDGGAIRVAPDGAPMRLPPLAGGLEMTVLSPDAAKLRKMIPVWERECSKAGIVPGEGRSDEAPTPVGFEHMGGEMDVETLAATWTKDDTAPANGTSIALLAEFGGKRILLGADAHPDLLTASLKRLDGGARVRLDLMKVPHHGSQANVTSALLAAVDCRDFLISTDGSKFGHPDDVAVARIVASRKDGVRLWFNYRKPRTTAWETRSATEAGHPFSCEFADEGGSVTVPLLP
ncbi:MAG: MBL fold metallo-hydrolase [Sphingomonas adhaesiva]|uniref:ComEC/Rec2 family competence protein n=1 Tax=Sphingomonas adhaesiva TaxID=28212 RepID=UPI002FF8F13C